MGNPDHASMPDARNDGTCSESQSQIYRLSSSGDEFQTGPALHYLGSVCADDVLESYEEVNERFPPVQNPATRQLYRPKDNSPLYVASFTSNSGTVTGLVIELQQRLMEERGFSPFEVVYLFTDIDRPNGINPFFNKSHNFSDLSSSHGIPMRVSDIDAYYQRFGYADKKDPRLGRREKLRIRRQFERETIDHMEHAGVRPEAVILDYYWSLCTPVITDSFLTINSHVGDLSVTDEHGRRLITGFHPVRRAIELGHDDVYSTTHIADHEADHGELLVRSRPLRMNLPRDTKILGIDVSGRDEREYLLDPENVEKTKAVENWYESVMLRQCDSHVLPLTLLLMSEGRFATDDMGRTYLNGHPMDPVLKL